CGGSVGGRSSQSSGNIKHSKFVKRRRFLERKGLLHDKQLPKQKLGQEQAKRQRQGQGGGQGQGHRPPQNLPPKTSQPWPNGVQRTFARNQPPTGPPASSTTSPLPPKASSHSQGRPLPPARSHPPPIVQPAQLLSEFQSGLPSSPKPFRFLAIDCEMVGTGPKGRQSELARCSIVGYDGDVVYDEYILPTNPVTDYRTRWSGISRQHLRHATPFRDAKKEILKILSGKVVVGHAIHNDFKALNYFHPPALTRDTSRIPLLNLKAGIPEKEPASLKRLTKAIFSKDIQVGRKGHSSVEDAKATMELYKVVEVEWERSLAS
ncbi:I20L2 protein, partial [Amia calva]|nr:I20L2 protein [Amia calva]